MTSPEAEANTSTSTPLAAGPSKSILSFWGQTATSAPTAGLAPPKRKRKKVENDATQAQLLVGAEKKWGLARVNSSDSLSTANGSLASGKGKGKAISGEEAERRQLVKRAKLLEKEKKEALKAEKEALKRSKEAARHLGNARGDVQEGIGVSEATGSQSSQSSPRNTPSKRKRARPHSSMPDLRGPSNGGDIQVLSSQANIGHLRSSSPTDVVVTGHKFPFGSPRKAGAVHNPIDVDDSPARARARRVFATDHKPAHSFFARIGGNQLSRGTSVASDGGASEASLQSVPPKVGKAHSFFKLNGGAGDAAKIRNGWGGGIREGWEWSSPLPGGDWPNHHGSVGLADLPDSVLRKRERRQINAEMDSDFWQHRCSRRSTLADPTRKLPASTFVNSASRGANRESWCERYRPQRASDVLGNVTEATYLRDWLHSLAVGSTERKITRKIKRPIKQSLDGWIVDDIGLFGDAEEEEEEDEILDEIDPPVPLGERPLSYPAFEARLTNAIVLAGPSGSGKSAAIYAAAHELDWEVFEVYPGIGRRTGGNLMSLVGDVGKNHMVNKGKQEKVKRGKEAFKSFFANKVEVEEPLDEVVGLEKTPSTEHDGKFRQSLILIDEADILFDEETSFWPTVISLIAESRRPVILTCNDLSLVPIHQLPLQAILEFRPPPASVAIAYLEKLALLENAYIPGYANEVYQKCVHRTPIDYLDRPLPPNGNEPRPYFDLRKAINQMQLDLRHPIITRPIAEEVNFDLREMFRQIENISFSDAFVEPRLWARMEVVEIDRHQPGPDDELGLAALIKPPADDFRPTFAAYDRSLDISNELLRLSGRSRPARDLDLARVDYIHSLLPILDPLIPLNSYLLPHPSLFADYMPIIQQIISADDMLEEAEEAAVREGGMRLNRKTGRSIRINANVLGREGYIRYLDLGEEALKTARGSSLC
ncbi:hypothetical protein P7C73_g5344, partial [Tremellales sp. Uapishka_1]